MTLHVPRLPFSLDPLIAEARRRAKQRRVLALVAASAVAAGALVVAMQPWASRAPGGAIPARLTVLAVSQLTGRAVFHLTCDPAGGNLPQPAKACAAIAAQPGLVTAPKPFLCYGGNPWQFTITGRLRSQSVHAKVMSCWTTQMALIDKLGLGVHGVPLLLEPRRSASVEPGQTRTFAPGTLRPGDLVTCRLLDSTGHPLALGVPDQTVDQTGGPSSLGSRTAEIKVGLNANGSVTASCIASSNH